jgi:threonine/homoserine/homoserine lactone efflux protein
MPLPEFSSLSVFVTAAFVLLITPGPAILYIVTRSIDQGRQAGLVSALGVNAGTLVHVSAAAAGLSALLATSATAFSVVKYMGAAYLIYLGVRRLLDSSSAVLPSSHRQLRLRRVFFDGFVVNILNPKTALFFLAFLPQFADVARGSVGIQILSLSMLFAVLGLIVGLSYASAAGTAAQWLRGHPRVVASERWIAGGLFIGLGLTAALSTNNRK